MMFRYLLVIGCGIFLGGTFAGAADAREGAWDAAEEAVPVAYVTPDPAPDPAPRPVVVVSPRAAANNPAPQPYKGLFYDNDFSYLEDPSYDGDYLGDVFKRRTLGPHLTFDFGGEYRFRHHNEHILARTNDFVLHRTRLYADVHGDDWFRVYVEAVDATTGYDDVLPPRAIEVNRFDALNMFGDLRLHQGDRGEFWFRGGRQELLYGPERLVSPLDWSNTRRTFDGLKGFWRGKKWDVDAWWTRPVPFGQHTAGGQIDHNFDRPDQSQEFLGVYAKCKALKNRHLDLYYIRYTEYDPAALNTFDFNTFGGRWAGNCHRWLWEIEGAYQFGEFGADRHTASFYTIGGGRKLDLPWNPVFWVYYDWASGDRDGGDGVHETFNQLFPLGHKYFGFIDLVARQNIEDWNFRITASPHKKVKLLLWWHVFRLQQSRDALYHAAGGVVFQDATGAAGSNVGQELDLIAKFLLTPRADLLLGYSHFYTGAFITNPANLGRVAGEDFYYGQFSLRF